MPVFQSYRTGCINWGLVAGKSQTIYNWATVKELQTKLQMSNFSKFPDEPLVEPKLWFHDIYRCMKDGTYEPFSKAEVDYIVRFTSANVTSFRQPSPIVHSVSESSSSAISAQTDTRRYIWGNGTNGGLYGCWGFCVEERDSLYVTSSGRYATKSSENVMWSWCLETGYLLDDPTKKISNESGKKAPKKVDNFFDNF
jgi:hypothetical protein